MKNQNIKKIEYFQGNLDKDKIYAFIDESGISKMSSFYKNKEKDIKEKGYITNENKTYTLAALIINSVKKYYFLGKEINDLKREYFLVQEYWKIPLHRCSLKSKEFKNKYGISNNDSYNLEKDIFKILRKHKIISFSVSCNKEVWKDNPKSLLNNQEKNNQDLRFLVFEKLINKINRTFLLESKKTSNFKSVVIIVETTDDKNNRKLVKWFKEQKENGKFSIIKKILITNKVNKNQLPILGNELVDFLCYSYWLWASNSLFHNSSKFLLHGFPNYDKNSLSLIQ